MRLLHTSDWHLGKRLFKLDRSPEHELFLDWLVRTLVDKEIDVLLIAGDIFDVPSPPHQSLELFYRFLHRVSLETKTRTYIIAGNHDSGLLLEAPKELLATHRVKVWGKLDTDPTHHWMDLGENLHLCAIPFFRSFELLPHGEGDAITALRAYLEGNPASGTQLLMLHHLAGHFTAAGSEQVISLTGLESIPSELFEKFSYVALGHIHKPQPASKNAFYSGSPIPMRFSETLAKSVMLLDHSETGIKTEKLTLPVFRQLVALKATEEDLREKLTALSKESDLTPMVEVQVELKAPVPGLLDEVKALLEAKGIELLSYMPLYGQTAGEERRPQRVFELSTEELFKEFYARKFPEAPELPEELRQDFQQLLEKVKDASSQT